ncbi:MAG: hypothetical protein JWQ16_123 [Novosphingobium sp.]|nr:hypothetical protein [Novosphingobium sp.]
MTKATSKSDRIRAKIADSDAQLQAEDTLPAVRRPDPAPPEKFSNLISEYPGLAIAAGVGIGLLAGVLLPRSTGRKLLRGGVFVASTASELGLAFGKQAVRKADSATRDGREMLGDTATKAGHLASGAGRKAADAGRKAVDVGREAGAGALHLAEDATERAHDLGLGLVKMAVEAASRLRK